MANYAFTWPASGKITSTYSDKRPLGCTTNCHPHGAVDIAPGGTVVAARDGRVDRYYGSAYGNYIIITHTKSGTCSSSPCYQTLYAHLASFLAADGARVVRGAPVGVAGETGTATGVHLHFEVRKDGAKLRIPETLPNGYPDGTPIVKGTPILHFSTPGIPEADYVSSAYPAQMESGTTAQASIVYRNVGFTTWTPTTVLLCAADLQPSPFYVSGDWVYTSGTCPSWIDAQANTDATGTTTFGVRAPRTCSATYADQWRLFDATFAFFGDLSPTWSVQVRDNLPPSVRFVKPTPGGVVLLGDEQEVPASSPVAQPTVIVGPQAVEVLASASDTGKGVARVEFWVDGAKRAEDATAPYRFTWMPVLGQHTLELRAYDGCSGANHMSKVEQTVLAVAG